MTQDTPPAVPPEEGLPAEDDGEPGRRLRLPRRRPRTVQFEAPHRRREETPFTRLASAAALRAWLILSWLLGHMPSGPAYAIGNLVAMLGYAAAPTRRAWIRSNAGHVLGVPPDDRAAGRLARAAYRNYVRYLLELMRLPWLSVAQREALLETEGVDKALELAKTARGVILVAPHMGNNEAAAAGFGSHGLPISVVGDDTALEGLYDHLERQRNNWGVKVIPWRNLRGVFGVLRRREVLGLLVDWGYRPDGIPVRFFGSWTTLPEGPALLAARHGSTILPFHVVRIGDDRFRLVLGDPILVASDAPEELARATQAIADQLEGWIAAAPEQWYIFKPIWPPTPEEERRLASRAGEAASGAVGGAEPYRASPR